MRIESLPDDFRQAPLDYNLRQTLIIPDRAKEPSRLAKVLALGSEPAQDGVHYPFTVAVGDIVLCNRYPKSFQGFHWGEEKVAVVSETEILAVVMPSDVTASTHKQKKPAKVLEEMRIKEGEKGGHVITHHFTHYDHAPEAHIFGKSESGAAHDHIAKHMNMPLDKEAAAGTEENVNAKEGAQL